MRHVLSFGALASLLFLAPAVSALSVEFSDTVAFDGVRAEYGASSKAEPQLALPGSWYSPGMFSYYPTMSWLGTPFTFETEAWAGGAFDPQASSLNPTFDETQLTMDDTSDDAADGVPEPVQPIAQEAQSTAASETNAVMDEGASASTRGSASNSGVSAGASAQAGSHSASHSTSASVPADVVPDVQAAGSSQGANAPPPDEQPAPAKDEGSNAVAIPAAVAPAYADVVADVDPVVAALTTATVVLGTTGAVFFVVPGWRTALWKLARRLGGLLLFSRIAQSDILNHERRSFLLEFVRQNPGERVEVARRALGFSNGSMHYHLRVLQARDLVRVHKIGGCARLFVAGPRVQPTPYVPARRKKFLEVLASSPGLTQRELAKTLGLSERMVSYHVRTLQSQGLLEVQADGFRKRLFPRPLVSA